MKKLLIVFFILLSLNSFANGPTYRRIYVNVNAAGLNNGTSWVNAYKSLQDALSSAANTDSIWVAAGTYYPTGGTDRHSSFVLKNGVALYGGFSGIETNLSARNLKTNVTILSGDIGTAGNNSDNSFHVIYSSGLDNTAILDGFTITGGKAYDYSALDGGGILNLSSSPSITNCIFTLNDAVNSGGAIANYTFSSPRIINCIFFTNNAAIKGGAVYNYDSSTPLLVNCSFSKNTSPFGSGMGNGELSSATSTNCIFWGNTGGDQIQNDNAATTVSYSIIQGGYSGTDNLDKDPLFTAANNNDFHLLACSPAINKGTSTSAPSNDLDGNLRPSLDMFDIGAYEFQSSAVGGIMYVNTAATGNNDGSSWINAFTKLQDALTKVNTCHDITQIWVAKGTYYPDEGAGNTDNSTDDYFTLYNGIGIYGGFAGTETQLSQRNWRTNVTILNGDIGQDDDLPGNTPNSSNIIRAIKTLDNSAVLDGFTITKAQGSSGAVYLGFGANAVIANCIITKNTGGLRLQNAGAKIVNCIFSNNTGSVGSAMVLYSAYPDCSIINCSFWGNSNSAQSTPAIGGQDVYASLKNCILWEDLPINIPSRNQLNAANCIIKGGYINANASVNNIIDKDPLFVNAANGDLHLQACSPAIDAGLNSTNSSSLDLDANARINHTTIDLGAYEYSGNLYTYYIDKDKDSYGSGGDITNFCSTLPAGYASNNNDCDDNNAAVNPTIIWYKDADNDGYSDGITTTQCTRPAGYKLSTELTAVSGDCKDDNAAVNPGKTEICGNGIDDNCNGQIDENCGPCANGTGFTTTNITSSSAQLNWKASVNPVQWQVEYKTVSTGSKWISILLPGAARSTTLSSLAANQRYQWHISAKCGTKWTTFSDAVQFTTLKKSAGAKTATNSLDDIEATEVMQVYPNPTRGQFVVEIQLDKKVNAKGKLELMNELGQTVSTDNASINYGLLKKQVNIPSTLTSGIYLVRMIVMEKTYIIKLVYQR